MLSFLLLIEEKKQKKIKASGTPAKFGWVLDGIFDDAEGAGRTQAHISVFYKHSPKPNYIDNDMAKMNFGGVEENVVTREEFPVVKALEALKGETIAVLGYGVQGPGQACNLRDNGFHVIVGQRPGKTYEKAVADGWVPGETLFSLEEAAERGTVICMLLSDAAQIQCWPQIKPHLTAGKTLYFSHGFAITWSDRTGIVPPKDIDVILVAPKGSGTSLRTLFVEGRGINSSYAVYQDVSGRALDKTLAIGAAR